MNALVIGRCPKTAEQLNTFCENVIIVLDQSFSRERNLPELDNFIIEHTKSNVRSSRGVLLKAKEIHQLIKKYNIDIVFSNSKWNMVAAKLASILVTRNVFLFATNHDSYSWQNLHKVRFMSILIWFTTDCYVALASFVYNRLKMLGHSEKRLVLVPNTISCDSWKVKKKYDCGKIFKIVYVAYVYPGKRQDMIVDILNNLKDKYDVIVDCYGDLDGYVDFVDKIKQRVTDMHLEGNLNFKGKIENAELKSILKDYDAYLSTSRMEMSPVNILEAQAVGLPVIAAKVGGIPDVIEDGRTGLLFEVDNVQSAVDKIELLINDKQLREYLGRSGRNYVSKEYTCIQAGERLKSAFYKNKKD